MHPKALSQGLWGAELHALTMQQITQDELQVRRGRSVKDSDGPQWDSLMGHVSSLETEEHVR